MVQFQPMRPMLARNEPACAQWREARAAARRALQSLGAEDRGRRRPHRADPGASARAARPCPEPLTKPYDYNNAQTIADFNRDDSFVRALMGPFGSGKSSGCVQEIIRRGQWQGRSPDGIRHSRWAAVRNTYPELRDTTLRTFFDWYPPHSCGHYVESRHQYTIKSVRDVDDGPCDIEVLFLALDRPEHVSRLLSLELTGGWINEGREIPWAIFDAMQGRVGRHPQMNMGGATWSGLWTDSNPPDSDTKWYRFFEEKLGADGKPLPAGFSKIFHQPSGLSEKAENLPNLPGERAYYERLMIGKSAEWIKVYVHGDYGFVMDGRACFPEYADGIHCKAIDPIPGLTVIRSFDYGLTPACAFSQVLPDGRWLTFYEMLSESMGIDEFSDQVLEHSQRAFRGWPSPPVFEDWGDPAGGQRAQTDTRTCFDIQIGKGIAVRGSIQNEQMRQESVRKPLRTLVNGEPQFILHPRCKALRKGFMGGYYRRRMQTPGVERYADKPVKNELSHIHDALQYGMVQYFAPALVRGGYPEDDPIFSQERPDFAAQATRDSVTGYASPYIRDEPNRIYASRWPRTVYR